MEWKLEVVPVPVSDVDRAKRFYHEQVGFVVDHDTRLGETLRLVQLTPPGSGCSIVIGSGGAQMTPGSLQGVQLVVDDLDAARTHLIEQGIAVTPIRHLANGEWVDGRGGPWNAFIFFRDPDGNGWTVQERPT
ncbi:MAG: glyoxalase [Dehalococcoidia bacterium]|nr:MAG: glyoxalase [Dehalococcoidia bacterium]